MVCFIALAITLLNACPQQPKGSTVLEGRGTIEEFDKEIVKITCTNGNFYARRKMFSGEIHLWDFVHFTYRKQGRDCQIIRILSVEPINTSL